MREFIDTQLIPLEPIYDRLPRDEWRVVQTYLQQQVKDRGLWGAFLDPKLGGAGFGQLKLALMSETIGRCMMSMGIFGVQAPDSGNMELLAHGATDAQKERWLWPNLRGEISSAFALTEPFLAGADPTVIGTTAHPDGDEWVIDGHKWFISRARRRHPLVVGDEPGGRPHAARSASSQRHPGMKWVTGTFALEPSPGRAGNPAALTCRNCPVPADHMIGAPGDGFVLAQQRLGGGRIHHAMRWLGQAQRSLDIMCERAVSRSSHGQLLAQHQMVQDYVALSHTEIQAARLLTFQTAWKMDTAARSSVIKAHVSKVFAVLDRTIQSAASSASTDFRWRRVPVDPVRAMATVRRPTIGARYHPPGYRRWRAS